MVTQIFIEPEIQTQAENSRNWEQICTDLSLQKQLKKLGKVEKIAIPYIKLDARSERVYQMLCSQRELYTAYDASTLPLEIVQEIQRCKDNEWFYKMEIWYDDKSPDPFLIGYDSKKWEANKYLIAQWGDELLPFEQLLAKAIQRYKTAYKRALNRLILDCESRKKDIEGDISTYIEVGAIAIGFQFPHFDNPIR